MKANNINNDVVDLDDPWVMGLDEFPEEDTWELDAEEGVVLDEVFH